MNELFEHQKSGIEFLKTAGKAILADEMGLGKSRMAIVAAGESGQGVLVVCPASLKINWKREIEMVYPDDEIVIISSGTDFMGDPRKRWWAVINYDILEKKIEMIENLIKGGMDTLILDEAHYIKGKSIRAKSIIGGSVKKKSSGDVVRFEGIAGKMKRVYCLTGTPILNRPIELFNLLKAIGHELGRVRGHYARRYCGAWLKTITRKWGPPTRFMDESGAMNLDELRDRIRGQFLRRKKSEVLNLPEKIISVVECEMDREWKRNYDTAWDAYLDFLTKNPIPERNIDNIIMARQLVEIQKLKQVCSRSKVKRMTADIENAIEQGEKVVVFSQYTETISQLADGCREIKFDTGKTDNYGKPILERIGISTLTGADDMDDRQIAVDSFQNDPDTKVFIANIKAGGVGINLTKASIVMFADMDWSPEIHAQAEDRTHRIGQEGTVNVYYYVCPGTIEEDIVGILNSKRNVANRILEGGEDQVRTQSSAEAFLRILAKKTSCA